MFLDKIAASTKKRIEKEKGILNEDIIKHLAYQKLTSEIEFPFEDALKKKDIHFICEVKKASPSKGILSEDFPYLMIAKEYENAGASCISVLTEPDYFMGCDIYLTEIKQAVNIPVLRKDFILDPYQIYQAKVLGADAVLLICTLLPEALLKEALEICDALGLSALVEAHNEKEIDMALRSSARIIGVNNRNLQTFEVDIHNAVYLRKLVPESVLFIAESGIKTPEEIQILRNAGVDGVLIGETLMKAENKQKMLEWLYGI